MQVTLRYLWRQRGIVLLPSLVPRPLFFTYCKPQCCKQSKTWESLRMRLTVTNTDSSIANGNIHHSVISHYYIDSYTLLTSKKVIYSHVTHGLRCKDM